MTLIILIIMTFIIIMTQECFDSSMGAFMMGGEWCIY